MLFLVTHPPDSRPSLIVETAMRIDGGAVERLKERMIGQGSPNGMLFDDRECLILRDSYASLDVASIAEDARVPAEALLGRVPQGAPDQRVLDWLRAMAANWNAMMPLENDIAAPLLTDIVPAIAGAVVEGVLDWAGEVPITEADGRIVGFVERNATRPWAFNVLSPEKVPLGWVYVPLPGDARPLPGSRDTERFARIAELATSRGLFSGHSAVP